MTISVAQQAAALAQAAALGLAVGLLYDLFRVLRVRVALPLLGAVLDLSFWIIAHQQYGQTENGYEAG